MRKSAILCGAGVVALFLAQVVGATEQISLSPEIVKVPQPASVPSAKAPAAKRKSEQAPRDVLARDLVLELREQMAATQGVDGGDAPAAYSASTGAADGDMAAHQVRVLSGEQAELRWVHSSPVQWTVSGQQGTAGLTAGGAAATQNMAAITQATTVVETGHTLLATPHWSGGANPVRVELQWQSDTLAPPSGGPVPPTQRSQLRTTVRVPLQQWVTIATRGSAPVQGSYSSKGAMEPQRALQLRVSLP